MREIEIADITLRNCENRLQGFKEKVETVRLLDNLNANVIETPLFSGSKTDIIFLHTIAGIVQNSTISVPVQPDEGTIKTAAEALCDFSKKAINIIVTASTVQMEYLSHKKPAAMIETLKSALAVASKYFENTEVTLRLTMPHEHHQGLPQQDYPDKAGSFYPTYKYDTQYRVLNL